MKNIIFTADRPTGKLHLGHYVGSLRRRLLLQNEGNFEQMYVMIADSQALTDNADNPDKIRDNIIEVALDYLSVGLDPSKITIFIQSMIPELTELTFYYSNLITVNRLLRNPTIKSEIKMRDFKDSVPAGFLTYPISQAADITAFKANIIPVGEDQLPLIEVSREIVRSFNRIYKNILVEPTAVLPENKVCLRLPGIDGNAKMSKSLGNGIYLSDPSDIVYKKVMSMYTDPNHLRVEDPGEVEENPVFVYLEAFSQNKHFEMFLPEYKNLEELKQHYRRGGLGDMTIKKFLFNVLEEILPPIRKRRKEYENNIPFIYEMLENGSHKARLIAIETMKEVKKAMRINYFEDPELIQKQVNQYKSKN